jgi:hypothetical protein
MIVQNALFATINILSAALAVSGGILGLFSFLYIRQHKEFIQFLVNHFDNALRKKNEQNRTRK